MSAESLARGLGLARVGLGITLLAGPGLAGRMAGIDTGTARRMSWLTRLAAARDVALGAGTLLALQGGRDAARWVAIAAAADLADTVILAGAVRQGRLGSVQGAAMAASAAGGAVAGAVAAFGLRRS